MSAIYAHLKKYKSLVRVKRGVQESIEILKFLYVQRIRGFSIPTQPYFDSDVTMQWFAERLQKSTHYLEYGSGGSTYLAAMMKRTFVTVDSDSYFLESVRRKIEIDGRLDPTSQSYLYADIGLTKGWGKPIMLSRPSPQRRRLFARYSDFPVDRFHPGMRPDLILVDGRFRVACALKATKALAGKTDWTLIIDDYDDRPHYKIVEDFLNLERRVGRMAVFAGALPASEKELAEAIAQYEQDWR